MLKDVNVVIFDIDGTLLDSVQFNVENMNRTLTHFGYTYRVSEERVKAYLGCTAEDYYRGVLDECCIEQWEEIRSYNRAHMPEVMAEFGRGFSGVLDTFSKLYKEGYKLVLYSNCSREYLEAALDVIGIRAYVDYAECVKDNGIEKPELINKIMGLYPGCQAVVVGDRIHDLEAARENQLPCVAALYGFGKAEMVEADYKIEHIDELENLLKGIVE